MKRLYFLTLLACLSAGASAQNSARITGNLQTNGNFFVRDSIIGAANTPQYDYQKYGAESWLNLNYSNWGFDIGVRFDVFHQSNIPNPTESYTQQGIGRWFVSKQIHNLNIAGGYLYDQIGTGIIFRAYEERALFIDQALYGVRLGYKLNDNWTVKAFTGRQKQQFQTYGTVVHGGAVEGFIKPDSTGTFSLAPGFGAVTRTYDQPMVDRILAELSSLPAADQEGAQYNTYAMTAYNTLTAGNFTWYFEGAYKTNDVIYDLNAPLTAGGTGRLRNSDGYTIYNSWAYSGKGLGVTLESKLTKDFSFRVNPYERGIQGAMNFLPVMAKQNTYRLATRFVPAVQELGEQAVQFDIRYALNKKWTVGLNMSGIADYDGTILEGENWYREIYPEVTYKHGRKWQAIAGVQFLRYNEQVYQNKGGIVNAVTPTFEYLYKFTPRRSVRVEAQYLHTKEEFGSWANMQVEVGLAPHWVFYVSDMYKIPHTSKEKTDIRESFGKVADAITSPRPLTPDEREAFVETGLVGKTRYDNIHFFSAGAVYSQKSNRFTLAYVKQVEGINCAGGICRYEPTFHGVRMSVNSSF